MAKYIGQGRGFQQRPRRDGHDDGKEEKVDSETHRQANTAVGPRTF